VVTSYWPRPKITPSTLIFPPDLKAFREIWGFQEQFWPWAIWRYHSAINRTIALYSSPYLYNVSLWSYAICQSISLWTCNNAFICYWWMNDRQNDIDIFNIVTPVGLSNFVTVPHFSHSAFYPSFRSIFPHATFRILHVTWFSAFCNPHFTDVPKMQWFLIKEGSKDAQRTFYLTEEIYVI